jgi:hypothetical protein
VEKGSQKTWANFVFFIKTVLKIRLVIENAFQIAKGKKLHRLKNVLFQVETVFDKNLVSPKNDHSKNETLGKQKK